MIKMFLVLNFIVDTDSISPSCLVTNLLIYQDPHSDPGVRTRIRNYRERNKWLSMRIRSLTRPYAVTPNVKF
jgi:hypothetical protein